MMAGIRLVLAQGPFNILDTLEVQEHGKSLGYQHGQPQMYAKQRHRTFNSTYKNGLAGVCVVRLVGGPYGSQLKFSGEGVEGVRMLWYPCRSGAPNDPKDFAIIQAPYIELCNHP